MTGTFTLTGKLLDKSTRIPVVGATVVLSATPEFVVDLNSDEIYGPIPKVTTDADGVLCSRLADGRFTEGVELVVGAQYSIRGVVGGDGVPALRFTAPDPGSTLDLSDIVPEPADLPLNWSSVIAGLDTRVDALEAGGVGGSDGTTGDKGPTGDKGATGDKGPTGDAGLKGATGDKGLTGDAGATGTAGATGPTGTAGATALIRDEGTALPARASLNFVGAGVTATDDSTNGRTTVTIPGGGNSSGDTTQVRKLRVGDYIVRSASSLGDAQYNEGEMILGDFWLPAGTYDAVGFRIPVAGSAGAVIKAVVYPDDAGRPGTGPLVDTAAVDATVSAGLKLITGISLVIPTGGAVIWGGTVTQGGATTRPKVTRISGIVETVVWPGSPDISYSPWPTFVTGGVTGAAPATPSTNSTDGAARLTFRRSA